ncbi:MAG: signal peptidase II [Acidobacteriota bacterium]
MTETPASTSARGSKLAFLLITAAIVGLDRWTKGLIERSFDLGESRTVISGFFDLTHVRNTGAAFGLFARPEAGETSWLLTGLGLVALGAIGTYFVLTPARARLLLASLALILGGAIGNLIDRLVSGAVTDFLDFYVGSHHWPSFNVADSAITVGIALMVIDSFRSREPTGG